jgi:hypothetical protein
MRNFIVEISSVRCIAFDGNFGHQHVQFTKLVGDGSAVKVGDELAIGGIDTFDFANVAVIHVLVIIVLDLHDLVAGGEGPSETLDLVVAGGIECSLQFDVQPPRFIGHSTWMSDGIDAKAFGNPCFNQLDNARNGRFRVVRLYKVEIALSSGRAEVGDRALVDAMGAGDDAALRGLPKPR